MKRKRNKKKSEAAEPAQICNRRPKNNTNLYNKRKCPAPK